MRLSRPLLIASFALSVLPAQGLSASPPSTIQLPFADWTRDFNQADGLLRAGEWKKGEKAARHLIGQIMVRPTEGKGLVELLARTVILRAIGEAGQGEVAAAQWDAAAARVLGLKPSDFDFGPYGEEAKIVRAALDPPAEDSTKVQSVGWEGERSKVRTSVRPVIPQADRGRGIGGPVMIEFVIDEQGTPRSPRILKSPSPRAALTALDALRQWRFAPATLAGKPVPVYFVLDMTFKREG